MPGRAVALLLVAVSGVAFDEAQIFWAPSWEEARKEATTRRVPILVAFLKDGEARSVDVWDTTFQDPLMVAYLNEVAVPLPAHTAAADKGHSPESIVDPRTGKTTDRCSVYKVITCPDHNSIHSEALTFLRVTETPRCFVLGPEGKPLSGTGEVKGTRPQDLLQALKAAQRSLGKPLSRTIYRRARDKLAQGRAHFEAEEFAPAIRALQGLAKDRKAPDVFRKESEQLLSEVNAAGIDRVVKAQSVLRENPKEGRRLLREMRATFRGLEAAEVAKRALVEAGKPHQGKGGRK